MEKKLLSDSIISVVIPLFNKEGQIKRCLDSVLNQTYNNIEVVVVNDGSTDDGVRVVESFNDSRVKIFTQPNTGVSVARNNGVKFASSEWIFFLDADDKWEINLIEVLLGLIHRCRDAKVVACPTKRVYADGSEFLIHLNEGDFLMGSEYIKDYFATTVRLGQSPFSNSSFAVHRNTFIEVGGYKPDVKLTEDSDLWVRLALIAPIAMTRTTLATYYVETSGNTREVPQLEKFEVVKTIEGVIAKGGLEIKMERNLKSIARVHKFSQIHRSIILGQRYWALRGLLDVDIWINSPFSTIRALAAIMTPIFLVNLVRKYKRMIW